MYNINRKKQDTPELHNEIEDTSNKKSFGKNILTTATKVGGQVTKTSLNISLKMIGRGGHKVNKKIKRTTLRIVKNFIIANAAIVLPIVVALFIITFAIGSVASSMLVVYAKDRIDTTKSEIATSVTDTYSKYLSEINQQKTIDYGEEEVDGVNKNPPPSLTEPANPFENTEDIAGTLDGKALLTQIYNTMVNTTNKYSTIGFDMEMIYGMSITEVCCSPIKWSIYVPIGNDYNAEGNYDISEYGVKEFMGARRASLIDTDSFHNNYNDGSQYITPWQMTIKGMSSVQIDNPYNWSSDTWEDAVSRFTKPTDATGDGIMDPFNMVDTMNHLGDYMINNRGPTITKVQLTSDTDRADMMRMIYSIRHVGTTNKTKTRSDGCAFSDYETNVEWRTAWCYPFIEKLNPHIDLLRSAVNEYKSNGPLFQEYTAFMHQQTRTNSNGPTSLTIIEKLYEREGWTKVGSNWSKEFGDGDGKVTIAGQDIAYPIRVYWGAKIGFPEFKKLAQKN